MLSSIYAALLALLIVRLSLGVIKLRRSEKVKLGDGGVSALQNAIRAQGNATEYVPISLILLILLELNGGHMLLIHLGGMTILAGRLLHAKGLLDENLRYRVLGMQLTIYNLIGLAVFNIGYAAYRQLFA
ncbi:MAPEG family protein [Methylomonas methanica]|uniref:Glutathione S-transfersae-related protein n=1 Tax=Methylomonas methanica (strain DSM 25384 / MC09) TaxID=857087 RepID=G0A3Y0_METMM|nr:MAPEG family protein [Methylomonas methanica]AEG02752.1 glutathione S-transfersae-related protein [Methylomonas methanica MC09]